jgi:hypothetical protein
MNTKAIKNYIIGAILISIFIVNCYFMYLTFYPFKTLVVNEIHTINSPKSGGTLLYSVDYCKYSDAPSTVYRTLHSEDESQIVPFPSVTTISILGCHRVTVPLQLFPSIMPGRYYMTADAVYKLNPYREIYYKFQTPVFTINQ